MAHDLRTPAITIAAFLDYLEADLAAGKHAEAKEDLQHLRQASQRLSVLTDELLQRSRAAKAARLQEAE